MYQIVEIMQAIGKITHFLLKIANVAIVQFLTILQILASLWFRCHWWQVRCQLQIEIEDDTKFKITELYKFPHF